jgi:3-oxoacyl-[acyl-carrier protein] reductase
VKTTIRKRVLITGGTKGIGYAIALLLAQSGYDLALTWASDEDAALAAAGTLSPLADIKLIRADISDSGSIDTIHSALEGTRLDGIIFNAGLTCRDSLEEIKPADWERIFFANVHFPVFLLQRLMKSISEGGSIVFTGSAMGIYPHAVSLSYGVSKSAVHALVKNLVKTLSPRKIRVNAIAPGFVDTDWQKTKPAEIRSNIESKIALGRFCLPEEVAEVYKLSLENQYLNGEIIVVDGGYSYK